jgi:hypothetical protein
LGYPPLLDKQKCCGGGKKGNRWAFHTKQETCSSVGFDFPEEECNMMGRKIMFQIENGRI